MPQNLLFFPYVFLLLFCSFAPMCVCFSFSFLFSLSFFFVFWCVWIFSNFSILSFNSHKLFFFEVVYTYNKAQKESLWHKTLFECLLYIPLSFVSTCIRFFFFFLLIFSFCVWIFSNFLVSF